MNAPILISYEEAVVALVKRCKEHGDPPSVEFAAEAVGALSPAGLREAARVGLIGGANSALHLERVQRNAKSSAKGYPADGGRNPRGQRDSLRVTLVGADGKLKELMEFTADDCELLRLNAATSEDRVDPSRNMGG